LSNFIRFRLNSTPKPSKNLATIKNHLSGFHDKWLNILLLCQGSNLDFSDPESDAKAGDPDHLLPVKIDPILQELIQGSIDKYKNVRLPAEFGQGDRLMH